MRNRRRRKPDDFVVSVAPPTLVVEAAARTVLRAVPGGGWLPRVATSAAARVRHDGEVAGRWVAGRAGAALGIVVERVLDQVDLTDLVRRHVDLDALVSQVDPNVVVGRVDVDAIADRVDVDAIVGRLDLAGIARQVIDAVDLPEIIRQSSGSMASETVRGVRLRSIDADETVNRIVDRVLLRPRPRRGGGTAGPEEAG